MQSLHKNEIPEYLKDSEFYKGIESDDSFEIPIEFYKKEIIINTFEDLISYIRIIDFWLVNKIKMNLLFEYFPNFQLIKEIQIIVNSTNNNLCNNIMNKKFFDKSNYTLIDGYSECLEYACNNGYIKCCSCTDAASKGHFYCLRNAHENGCKDKYEYDVCYTAAGNGHLDCLIYAHENKYFWYIDTCSNAAGNGHLDCLIYAHENGCVWNKQTCELAAKNGHLDCLKYAHENGCEWTK